jgi:predicted metal-dependent phosphoesterase TrpH
MEPRLPTKTDGVFRIDFHVHTNRSPEGIHSLVEIIARAKRVGLDGIAITDHNRLLTREVAAKLSKIHDFLVIGGIEGGDLVRHRTGDNNAHKHWIALNIDHVPRGDGMGELAENVRDEGGLSIAPHPYAMNGFRDYDTLRFDAVESLNGTRRKEEVDVKAAKGLGRVGGTDAHAKYMLGHTWTDVYSSSGSLESILENVRKGNCTPRGSGIPLHVILAFYFAVLGRYLFSEPCELIQTGSRLLRKFC